MKMQRYGNANPHIVYYYYWIYYKIIKICNIKFAYKQQKLHFAFYIALCNIFPSYKYLIYYYYYKKKEVTL